MLLVGSKTSDNNDMVMNIVLARENLLVQLVKHQTAILIFKLTYKYFFKNLYLVKK